MKTTKVKTEQEDATMEEFVVVGNGIPFRPKQADGNTGLDIHQLPDDKGVLISYNPPIMPDGDPAHVPVDITLVIDVSGSMQSSAPLPDTQDAEERESAGLSILDLTKHAARTILASLNEYDRLALVTFSNGADVVQDLTYVSKTNRKIIETKIDNMQPCSATNLWAGIRTGLNVFNNASDINNVQGMFVLTDGMPNHMCPPQGYVAKLQPILAGMSSPPTIHTFGFGYEMRSELMQSIAEVGNGNYAFIPDAGMIGTIFVHAMANLFSTFASGAELELRTSDGVPLQCSTVFNAERPNPNTTIFRLGNIQYGQSRDLLITNPNNDGLPAITSATLNYKVCHAVDNAQVVVPAARADTMSPAMLEYHALRSELCEFLASFFPYEANGEHSALGHLTNKWKQAYSQLDNLVARFQKSPFIDDPNVRSLYNDLIGEDASAQISQALQTKASSNFWLRWGRHYLPSLLHAHARQICNSFKDPGPLRYGVDSPLFIKCRDTMDATFENMPAPKPSRPPQMRANGTYVPHSVVSMARYHSRSNPCFEGQCEVKMGDGTHLAIENLRSGMTVWTPKGERKVIAIVKTNPRPGTKDELCRVGDLWVTPYHPINIGGNWVFPADVAEESKACTASVYSVLLAYSSDSEAHAIDVGGQLCVTLGHGVQQATEGAPDARAHAFFGSYVEVARSLIQLTKDTEGRRLSSGVGRDAQTGLVCRFRATNEVEEWASHDMGIYSTGEGFGGCMAMKRVVSVLA
jgi:hypothetical protein